jgi:hypothetical protein
LTFAFVSEFAGKLTVPADTVKPLEAVNVVAQVIVFEVKSPEFVIDPDVEAPVLVIVFDDKAPVLLIVLDCNVFKVDGPRTFRELVRILSDCSAFETNEFLLNVCGITLFGNSTEGYEAIIINIFILEIIFLDLPFFLFN